MLTEDKGECVICLEGWSIPLTAPLPRVVLRGRVDGGQGRVCHLPGGVGAGSRDRQATLPLHRPQEVSDRRPDTS